ncbi:hypothetical protein N8720_04260 [Candidatus Marinimicrobia bacterium]|nr:hypothetical protein [Candidatus Neomarinimicrobiota bacterium]
MLMTIKDREDKFVILAEKRVQKALKALRLVKNLANKNNYTYTDKDANKISRALLHEVQNVRVAFRKGGKSTDEDFKLR